MKNNKSINDITLFRYLFNLDSRNLPQSILNWYNNIGSVVDSNRESAIRELSRIKGNCRNLVIFSKTFIDTMDKSYMKFTQFHMDILNELDNENGIVRSPYGYFKIKLTNIYRFQHIIFVFRQRIRLKAKVIS